jgi:hypothetical protein
LLVPVALLLVQAVIVALAPAFRAALVPRHVAASGATELQWMFQFATG